LPKVSALVVIKLDTSGWRSTTGNQYYRDNLRDFLGGGEGQI